MFNDNASGEAPCTLESYLQYSNDLLSGLVDPEYGAVGQALLDQMAGFGVQEIMCTRQSTMSAYTTFDSDLQNSFINAMSYRPAMRDRRHFAIARHHEMAHAGAYNQAPVLHTNIYNRNTPLIPTPRQYTEIVRLLETDAMAKAGWQSSLMVRNDPSAAQSTEEYPVSAAEFEQARVDAGSLTGALASTGRLAMNKIRFPSFDVRDGHKLTMTTYYQYEALKEYESMLDELLQHNRVPMLVHLSAEDLGSIGNSYGPNFLKDSDFLQPVPLRDLDEQKLQGINAKLGITDDVRLPLFKDALAAQGYTPRSFMGMSMNGGRKVTKDVQPAQISKGLGVLAAV